MDYPVLEVIPELKKLLTDQSLVILQAPPGAGKSTVLPLKLLDEPWLQGKKIIMLEPRRLAARTAAGRLASQLDEEVGETIGYRIRFETCVSAKTRLEVVTEGILTRMIQSDTALTDVGMVIFDEFHERSLQADLGLALCLQTQEIIREDLRILIMSATMDTDKLAPRLGNPPVVKSTGRQYPVDVRYLDIDPTAPLATRMARAISKASREDEGDILAFLPGVGEIKKTQQLLEETGTGALLCPIYGDLPLKKQQEAIMPDPSGRRKIILATAIAETSLTIEGVRVVVDSGYSRVPRFDVRSALTRLETVKVTRDSADQRAGRAGRLGPGICYRLWPSGMQHNLVPARNPEILDADLSALMLELGQWGVRDVTQLKWITLPPAGAVLQARELLNQLGAMEDSQITPRGKEMLRLPTHPRIAHMLLEAMNDGLPAGQAGAKAMGLASDLAALLEERDPLEREASVDLALRIEILRK